MNRQMNGLSTTFSDKMVGSAYHFRSQDKWTNLEQTKYWDAEDHLDDIACHHNETFCDEYEFEQEHSNCQEDKLEI